MGGSVSTSQPLATSAGLKVLAGGGTAAQAALACAAVLAVVEPCSTGLGGDMFAILYDGGTREVKAVNGSGRSPRGIKGVGEVRREMGLEGGQSEWEDPFHPLAVTVPGAVMGWQDLYDRFCKDAPVNFTLRELLQPAIDLAGGGFPVPGPITANAWKGGVEGQIKPYAERLGQGRVPFTIDGARAPEAGEVFKNPELAAVLSAIADRGAKDGFYGGEAGRSIVETLNKLGSPMTLEDLTSHESTFPEPISSTYRSKRLYEVPPNTQGIAGLIALTALEAIENSPTPPEDGTSLLHAQIECMRLGFSKMRKDVADPDHMKTDPAQMLDREEIRKTILGSYDPNRSTLSAAAPSTSCTVSFQTADKYGNAVSFVNSNYMGFGSGIVPPGCGFSLQNRGAGFSLEEGHPNAIAPGKLPFHTIIPAIATHADTDELYATMTNMGGFMQPQGHMQLLVNLERHGMNSQEAVDAPRFCIRDGKGEGKVFLEDGFGDQTLSRIKDMGHNVENGLIKGFSRSLFGRAQIITRDRETGVLCGGSDGRADGQCSGL